MNAYTCFYLPVNVGHGLYERSVTYPRPKIYDQDMNMWNVHIHTDMENVRNVHKHIGIRKTRNWFRYETFYYLFEFKVFRHEERERHTIFFYADFSIWPSPRAAIAANYWSGLGELRKSTYFVQAQILTYCFFSNPKILCSSLPGMTSFTSPVIFPLWGFYCDISDCHIRPARAWTPALNVCT